MDKHYKSISIVIPVYNQADHITDIVQSYISALQYLPCKQEYILVVNACRDQSLEKCTHIKNSHNNVHVIHSEKGGWGLAIKLGLMEAKGDLVCYTNSARTQPQDLVLSICYAISNPGTVIKANRKIRSKLQRRLGSLLYNLQCRMLFDLVFWDINGTPKIFPSKYHKLMQLNKKDDLIDLEFNVICKQENYPLIEIPIYSAKRHGGKSTTNYHSAFKMYWGAFKMWRDSRKNG